ncbi:MAG: hypothetical protein QM703_21200 [Gemmatales bacterium]
MASDATSPVAISERPRPSLLHDWVTTVDHKKIGILYILLSVVFLVIGGCEAILIRLQLLAPTTPYWGRIPSTRCSRCMAPQWFSSWACPF